MNLSEFMDEPSPLAWFHAPNHKIKVGYRRCAGKIGLTDQEQGTRGAWVEKRVTLFKTLIENGCEIILLSPATVQTQSELKPQEDHPLDLLVLEFAGTNLQFYGKDWERTVSIIQQHKGRIWFVCDDPDLTFLWELLENEDWSRWTIIANSTDRAQTREILKCPKTARLHMLPMIGITEFWPFNSEAKKSMIYIGRPNGRARYFKNFQHAKTLEIAGKAKEWTDYPSLKLVPIPQQRHRAKFYNGYAACLALFDARHCKTGWRTGRAYHALAAGCPVFTPQGNDGLSWCYKIDRPEDIDNAYARDLPRIYTKQLITLKEELGTMRLDVRALLKHL